MSKAKLQPADYLFWAVKQPIENTIQKLLLIVLADRANKQGLSHASQSTLAKDCGCARRSIIYAQLELEKLGLITISQRSKDGIKTSNIYKVNLVNSHVQEVHNDVQELHKGSARGALGVVQEVHIKHPSLNTQLNTYINPYNPLDQFDEFYSA